MKYGKKHLRTILALGLAVVTLAGCGEKKEADSGQTDADSSAFSYSDGIDDNGFWKDVKATDYVESFDKTIKIPADVHTISETDAQNQITSLLASYSTSEQITTRAVQDSDTVNIDYVGSVDGVEFSGGNTNGSGTKVTIGVTNYIDDFLEQLIGHTPGETLNVEVTFPDEYPSNPDLAGKDAIFVTKINYIEETKEPELTDEFVATNFAASNGWNTVDEMKTGVYTQLQKNAISTYVQDYLVNDVEIKSIPQIITDFQNNTMVNYYTQAAEQNAVELNEYLANNVGVSSIDELIEQNAESNAKNAKFYLVVQAVAEQEKIAVTDAETEESIGKDVYAQYEEVYGKQYLTLNALVQKTIDYLVEHAELV